ncbi:MAG: serine/threonine protein kinase [Cyanobacteria bacterium SZAS TMP-1]|nr:serine/threonine protein kinase [Cyanobacteria bacterium SZAS TMP-1]
MLKDTFRDEDAKVTNKEHKVIVSLPDDYSKLFIAAGVALIPLWFTATFILILRRSIDLTSAISAIFVHFWPLWLVCSIILATGITFFLLHRREHRRLKLLDISAHGLSLGRLEDRASEAFEYMVTWKEIKSVEELPMLEPGKSWIVINSNLNVSFKLSNENAFCWVAREDLMDGLIRYAPQAELKLNAEGHSNVTRDISYTNLWLETLDASGKRKRMGPLDNGDRIGDGKYEIIREIGAGGQGRAYLANVRDQTLPFSDEKQVVLKEYVLPTLMVSLRAQALERNYYSDEALILSKVNHPGIMKIFDSFEEDYRGYLVLEYVRGTDMRTQVGRHGRCPESQAVRIALELCEIVAYMHGLSPPIIHGDITPENIIVQQNGLIKLIDFTVAHEFVGERKSRVAGKQGYVAPEQYEGQTLPQSDIYALGCTLFYLLSARERDGLDDPNLLALGISVSPALNEIVGRCVSESLEKRYARAEELQRDLQQLQQQSLSQSN